MENQNRDLIPANTITIKLTNYLIWESITDAQAIAWNKYKQGEYKSWKDDLYRRFLSGAKGEIAVQLYSGMNCHDSSITTREASNRPDCIEGNFGVKTFTYKLEPDRRNQNRWTVDTNRCEYPQVLAVVGSDRADVHIVGVATPQLLREWGQRSEVFTENRAKRCLSLYDESMIEQLIPIDVFIEYLRRKSA